MKKQILILILATLMIFPMVAGELIYQQNTFVDLKIPCSIDGARCSDASTCTINIRYPNESYLKDNVSMTNLGNGEFNITLDENDTAITGKHQTTMYCIDGLYNGTATFEYDINPLGTEPTESKSRAINRAVYFLFIIGLLLFVFAFAINNAPPVKWTFFAFSILFFVAALNIISINLTNEVVGTKLEGFFDGFLVIAFYFYWFVAGLLILMWVFSFFNTWIYKKNLRNAQKYGGF